MEKALNDQINKEIYSAYMYLAMSAYFESVDLPGFANWMRVQWQEELAHAQKFYDYVFERDGRVALAAIDAPPIEWKSALDAFEETLKHEKYVSSRIHDLVRLARDENDVATENFLQWFVTEQVEEEASAKALIQQLKLVGDSGQGLFLTDRELGTRVFTPPQ
jgi:ferritin